MRPAHVVYCLTVFFAEAACPAFCGGPNVLGFIVCSISEDLTGAEDVVDDTHEANDGDELDETVAWEDADALESLETLVEDEETVGSNGEDVTTESDAESEVGESGSETEGATEVGEQSVEESEVEETSAVESEEESEGSEESPQLLRQSTRRHVPRKVFTYSELGGNPVREAIT